MENGSRVGTSFGGRSDKANKWQFWFTVLFKVMPNFSTILLNYASIVQEQQSNDCQIDLSLQYVLPNGVFINIQKFGAHKQRIPWSSITGQSHWYNSCGLQLHHIEPHRKIMWCGAVFRHAQVHEDVDIVSEATGFTSVTGRQYIPVFHETFYMPEPDHNLINPNQFSISIRKSNTIHTML